VRTNSNNSAPHDRQSMMIRRRAGRAVVCLAMACVASVLSARPADAQATYQYVGNPFTMFSCGPNPFGAGSISCSTPDPTNLYTSYTATDHVVATLVLDNPLPADLPDQDVRTFAGFSLTMNDGQHTVATPYIGAGNVCRSVN
jgi:hypothetical protein